MEGLELMMIAQVRPKSYAASVRQHATLGRIDDLSPLLATNRSGTTMNCIQD